MRFTFAHTLAVPTQQVFAFHDDPAHLELLMREWPNFRMLHHDRSVRPGSMTWCEQSILGCIPVVMGFRHYLHEPPVRFAEELIHGPFKSFTHIHEFESCPQGTIVKDILEITLPWHYGGEWTMKYCVAPGIRRFFAYRAAMLDRMVAEGYMTESTRQN